MAVTFTDSDGVVWDVWEVLGNGKRAVAADQRVSSDEPASGWLCFYSVRAKRRLMRYPPQWQLLSPKALEKLCALASPATPEGPGLHVCADSLAYDLVEPLEQGVLRAE